MCKMVLIMVSTLLGSQTHMSMCACVHTCAHTHTHFIVLITVPGTYKHMRTLANTMSACCYLTWGTGPVLPHVPKMYLSVKVSVT